jgi:hypothetical protein
MVDKQISDLYQMSQRGIADLKTAIHALLANGPAEGMTNAEIGRTLGIYQGHIGHEGHIPRTLLAMMEADGVVTQNVESKKWTICSHQDIENNER